VIGDARKSGPNSTAVGYPLHLVREGEDDKPLCVQFGSTIDADVHDVIEDTVESTLIEYSSQYPPFGKNRCVTLKLGNADSFLHGLTEELVDHITDAVYDSRAAFNPRYVKKDRAFVHAALDKSLVKINTRSSLPEIMAQINYGSRMVTDTRFRRFKVDDGKIQMQKEHRAVPVKDGRNGDIRYMRAVLQGPVEIYVKKASFAWGIRFTVENVFWQPSEAPEAVQKPLSILDDCGVNAEQVEEFEFSDDETDEPDEKDAASSVGAEDLPEPLFTPSRTLKRANLTPASPVKRSRAKKA